MSRCALLWPIALCLALCATAASGEPASEATPGAEFDVVDLVPEEPPKWSPTNLFAPITGFFLGGPSYWYAPRVVEIETTPPGAVLDLFYVRRNFQKRYEQADAPVRVILPSRVEATDRDTLTVRALLDGHQQKEVQVLVRSRTERLMIDLAPLPNSLLAFTHTFLAGRGSLAFLTKEALTFRLQSSEQGFSVVLTETANTPEADEMMRGVESPAIEELEAQQLGEDLLVRVALTDLGRSDAFETRSRQWVDPVRGLHVFSLDLVPRAGDDVSRQQARDALARISSADVTGCALEFDAALREGLESADLARALTPNGAFTDNYLRAAMKRLGEVSPDGVIRMRDGSRFRVSAPIELMAAASQPDEALGYLALLRRFVALLEPTDESYSTLRGLVAPELSPERFRTVLDEALARERRCSGSADVAATP